MNATRQTAAVVAALALGIVSGCLPRASYDQEDLQRDVDAIRNSGTVGVQARVTSADSAVLVATSGVADLDTREPVPVNGHYRIAATPRRSPPPWSCSSPARVNYRWTTPSSATCRASWRATATMAA